MRVILPVVGLLLTVPAPTQQPEADAPPLAAARAPAKVASGALLALGDRELASPRAAAQLELAQKWLLRHQDDDGRWNSDEFSAHDGAEKCDGAGNAAYDVAVTGLALFALSRMEPHPLGAGSPLREPLLRGARWLGTQQAEQNGLIGGNATHDFVYGHAIATLGLCAVTSATGDETVRTAAQAGLDYLERHRNPYSVWRYRPRDNDNDSSVTTWATLANVAGRELGLAVPEVALDMAAVWFDLVTDERGRVGYTKAGEFSSRLVGDHAQRFPPQQGEAMTAAGLFCLQLLGRSTKEQPQLERSVALLLAKLPRWEPERGHVDHCYWFFAAEALRRVGSEELRRFGDQLLAATVKSQHVRGPCAGSWDPVDPWGENGGRVYSTAMTMLALQALREPPK